MNNTIAIIKVKGDMTLPEQRVSEAKKLGFKRCIVPAVSMKTIGKMEGIEILGVENVNQAMNLV